jgi:hypothetical protein
MLKVITRRMVEADREGEQSNNWYGASAADIIHILKIFKNSNLLGNTLVCSIVLTFFLLTAAVLL